MALSCTPETVTDIQTTEAFVPVYMSAQVLDKVSSEPPRATKQAGKMYVFGHWLFQNEINEGIHIIDASNKTAPVKISFLAIPLNTEIAVKGNYLYANNMSDLLTFNIADPSKPVLVKRIPNVFPMSNQQYPPFVNVAFECADPAKGVVIRWERKQMVKANCRR